jgi:tellurite resistance protein
MFTKIQMHGFLSSILKMPASASLLRLGRSFKSAVWSVLNPDQLASHSLRTNPQALNCRVQLTTQQQAMSVLDVFAVQICGLVRAQSDTQSTIVRVSITDVTDEISSPKAVYSRLGQWQMPDSLTFCYEADLGRVPNAAVMLSDWMTVAQLPLDWLTFPLKGKRNLRFSTSILSRDNGQQLASAACSIIYENYEFGYMDLQENIQQARTLAVAVAFAVAAADGKLHDCEIELIKDWVRAAMDLSNALPKARRKLERALNKTVAFFRNGNQIDVFNICRRIVELAPIAVRYDILGLCLHVVKANGVATAQELALLKNLATCLEVDMDRFREMMGRILPVSMHQVKDLEFVLGINSDMSTSETVQRLSNEYRKWNARVTNSDPEIRKQADNMLDFIAKTRSECVA